MSSLSIDIRHFKAAFYSCFRRFIFDSYGEFRRRHFPPSLTYGSLEGLFSSGWGGFGVFAAGVTALTTQQIVEPRIATFVRNKLNVGDCSFSDALVKCFHQSYIVRREQGAHVRARVRSGVLEETWLRLKQDGALEGRRIAEVLPGGYFTVLSLDDGSVGAAMSYYEYPLPVIEVLRRQLKDRLACDPLLMNLLFDDLADTPLSNGGIDQMPLLLKSLQVSLVSALSARSLQKSGEGTRIIVQGQSGGIHPAALFARGVAVVATTRKPQRLAELAKADPSGHALRELLEGGLPWIYLNSTDGPGE